MYDCVTVDVFVYDYSTDAFVYDYSTAVIMYGYCSLGVILYVLLCI